MTPPFGPTARARTREEEVAARQLEEAWAVLHAAWSAWRHAPDGEAPRLETALDTASRQIEEAGLALERVARLKTGSR